MPDSRQLARLRNSSWQKRALMAILILAAGVGVVLFTRHAPISSWDLRNNLWGPGYLLLHGQSPYRIDLLFDNSNAVWFPAAIGLFFPFGWLTAGQAASFWLSVNLGMIVAIVWLSSGVSRPRPLLLGLCVVGATLFPATISHLILGQFTIMTVLLLLLAARLVGRDQLLLAGLLVALSLTKPQIAVLVLPGMVVAYWRAGGLKVVARIFGVVLLWTAILSIPLWVAVWAQPANLDMLQFALGTLGVVIWGILALTVLGVTLWLWATRTPQIAVIWSLALTTLVSPYAWSWDFVMLIPLAVYTFFHLASAKARGLMALGYVGISGVMIYIRLCTDNSDYRYWWVPWVTLAVIAGAHLISRMPDD